MSGARTSALAALRGQIERIETAEVVHHRDRVALGHRDADSALKGGLARAAIHEVFCEGRQGAAATGFVTGLAGRMTADRPLLWVRQDFSDIETGALSMSGLIELGLDPRRLVMVRAADVESALRTSADALACDALGAVVLEIWGATLFDVQLVRNRHGPLGRWIMEWKCDECQFSEPSSYPQPLAAAPSGRS